MLRLIQFLLFGHIHKWKERDRFEIVRKDDSIVGIGSFCECEKCGVHRKFDMV